MIVVPQRVGLGRSERPSPPPAVAEEVELYARESGRHATIEWVPVLNCWLIRFTLRETDPLRALERSGARGEQFEDVLLQEPNPKFGQSGERPYRSLDPWQMGASGVRAFLERGNTWSGRGEFKSHAEAVRKSAEHNRAVREGTRRTAREHAIDLAGEVRRQVHKIPFFRTGIDLKGEKLDG